jgi:hypothetical protein
MRSLRQWAASMLVVFSLMTFAACQKAGNETKQADGTKASPENSAEAKPAEARSVTIPEGTELQVRLVDAVGSAHNQSGDTFLATLDDPLMVGNSVAAPKGAKVTGRVTAAQASGHLQTPAELALTLTSIEISGATYDIATSGYVSQAKSHAKRNAAWIGGGAAGGALLGALVGGKKGAAIGAGAGAGGGTATAYATGRKDILLPSETRLSFTLKRPLTVELAA